MAAPCPPSFPPPNTPGKVSSVGYPMRAVVLGPAGLGPDPRVGAGGSYRGPRPGRSRREQTCGVRQGSESVEGGGGNGGRADSGRMVDGGGVAGMHSLFPGGSQVLAKPITLHPSLTWPRRKRSPLASRWTATTPRRRRRSCRRQPQWPQRCLRPSPQRQWSWGERKGERM